MNKNSNVKYQMSKVKSLFSLTLIAIVIFVLWGCATIGSIKEPPQLKEAPVITGIELQDYTVTVMVNKPFVYTIYRSDDPYKMVVELPDVSIGTFKSKIVSDKAGITEIVPSQVESPSFMARLEMLLQTPSMVEPEYKNNELKIRIKEEAHKEVLKEKEDVLERKEPELAEMPEEKIRAEEVMPITEGRYTGKKISLDFQDADIVAIFRLLADISGYNIVVSPEVKGRLTMKLINVPWDQALDLILKTFSLGKSIEGNIIRIAPHTVFAKESEERAKAKEADVLVEPMKTMIFPISYAKVKDVETALKDSKILTPRGSVSTDVRTSSVLVKDIPAIFPQVENLLKTLDMQTPQVLIEARIVEVSTSDVMDLGIQWGFSQPGGSIPFRGATPLGTGPFTGSRLLVDFPAISAGPGAGFAFGILGHGKTAGLDLQLTALEKVGKSRIISNPRVVTTDNEKAKIMQGESIPYPQATAEGTISAAFKDVALSIEVTPHITPEQSIALSVKITKEDFTEFVTIGYGQAPRTSKIEGDTKVLIQNGETLVIGGVYKKTERESTSGVPALMKIPVLGWLFKKTKTEEETTELMIFITPRIVEKPT
ncbi:MAG: type IV pilus secretin PilQ [Nitrospirota bacterium]